jgi:hypothetical protein
MTLQGPAEEVKGYLCRGRPETGVTSYQMGQKDQMADIWEDWILGSFAKFMSREDIMSGAQIHTMHSSAWTTE